MLDRRQFLAGLSGSAVLAATHGPAGRAAAPGRTGGRGGAARLLGMRLRTAAPLDSLREFYGGLMGCEVVGEGRGEITVQAGETAITFVRTAAAAGEAPFYHFAFNIPENKLLAAREWQLARTPLIPPYPRLRDPRYPDDVVHFTSWNAHSVFFWDPAGNLLEHIARHDLDNAAGGPFTRRDILYASEIGLIADDVPALAAELRTAFDLPGYRRGSAQFTAVGDELGLLLVMRRGRALGFDEGRPAAPFAAEVSLRGGRPGRFSSRELPFEIVAR